MGHYFRASALQRSPLLKLEDREAAIVSPPPIVAWTDGALDPKTRSGGWGAIILPTSEKAAKKLKGFVPETTSQHMELEAVVKALRSIPSPSSVVVYTDSRFMCDIAAGEKGKYIDRMGGEVMKRLYEAMDFHLQVECRKVPAHARVCHNETVHRLARSAVWEGGQALNIPIRSSFKPRSIYHRRGTRRPVINACASA